MAAGGVLMGPRNKVATQYMDGEPHEVVLFDRCGLITDYEVEEPLADGHTAYLCRFCGAEWDEILVDAGADYPDELDEDEFWSEEVP